MVSNLREARSEQREKVIREHCCQRWLLAGWQHGSWYLGRLARSLQDKKGHFCPLVRQFLHPKEVDMAVNAYGE